MQNVIRSDPAGTARPLGRRRILWLCVVGWTIFVGLGLWWLLRGNAGPTVWVFREADSPHTGLAETLYGFSRIDSGLQRVCPWILLGPYVALAAWYFPLERGQLRLRLPLNLVACAVFLAASHAITSHTPITITTVTVAKSEATRGSRETNRVQVQTSKMVSRKLTLVDKAGGQARERPANNRRADAMTQRGEGDPEASLTNLFGELPPGFKPPLPMPRAPNFSLWPTLLDLLAYGALVGLTHSIHFYRRFREREHRAVVLESNLAKARLNALRAQLHPHFLFNSLNAVAALLRRDPRLAEATLTSLSELLRLALSQSDRQEVTVREEMQFIERYLEIQQTRFGDKLRVEQNVEPAALDCLAPALVFQPLIENAIRHGIEPGEQGGLLRLMVYQEGGKLVLMVEDDGVGLPVTPTDRREPKTPGNQPGPRPPGLGASSSASVITGGTGIGLTNLQARLETLYGARQKLELAPRPEGGVTVRLEIPCHRASAVEFFGAGNS